MSTLANAVAFISMSTSAYTCVVSSETWPSHARMVLMSTPERRRWTAVVCLLFRPRNSRHYAGFPTIPGEASLGRLAVVR